MTGNLEPTHTPDEAGRATGTAGSAGEPAGVAHARRSSPKPYQAPRMVAYGRLSDVTRFGGSQIVDSGGGLGPQPGG